MKTKEYCLIAVLFILLLAAAVYAEKTGNGVWQEGKILRDQAGGSEKTIAFYLEAAELPENYLYELKVEPTKITKELAEKLFAQACEEIDRTFYAVGDNPDHVTQNPYMESTYADGLVQAEWYLDDYSCIGADGIIHQDLLQEKEIVGARVDLTCGAYRQAYEFFFVLCPKEKTASDLLLQKLQGLFAQQYESGAQTIVLPKEVDGVPLQWKEKKEPYVIRVLFLELAILGLLFFVKDEKKKENQELHRRQLEKEYPEAVSRLAILLGAGCSIKSALGIMAKNYMMEREKGIKDEKPLYEELVYTHREMMDGESERSAYRKFGERCSCPCCLRLSRLLLQNLQKGNADLCKLLLAEADSAFEERKLAARKEGEEAGTKLLLPLVLMMAIVMAIVIMPALFGFMGKLS